MLMTIQEIEEQIVSEFSMFDDWMDKYSYLIEIGSSMPSMNETYKTEDNLIKGCQSQVWFHAELRDGLLYFEADSDAIITKGIISLLIKIYSGRTSQEILSSDFSVVEKIGLKENLSPTRANGLVSMIQKIREIAAENC